MRRRRHSRRNPHLAYARLNPIPDKRKRKAIFYGAALGLGVVGAIGLIIWASKPAQAAEKGGGKLATGEMGWVPVSDMTIRSGNTYRLSTPDPTDPANAALVAQLTPYTSKFDATLVGISVFPSPPSDWPSDDVADTTRVRMQFTAPSGFTAVTLPKVAGVRLWMKA